MKRDLPETLGNIDALHDDFLNDDTFVQTQCYEEVLKDHNFLIVGRKGVGKSALARMIPEREKGKRWSVIYLAGAPDVYFNDLERDFSNNALLKCVSSSEFMYQLWEHFILESCMKLTLKSIDGQLYTGDAATIYGYLKSIDQADLDKISTISNFFSHMVEIVSPSLELMGAKLTTGSGEKLQEYYNSTHNYDKAVRSLGSLLLGRKFSILFLIDDVDENIMTNSNSGIVEDFIVQLFKVLTDINSKFNCGRGGQVAPSVSVKAFIPTDIYSWLDLRHEDKFRSNKYELTWTDGEMASMFRKRLAEGCRLGNMSLEEILKKYFGNGIWDTYGNRRDVLTYMLEHTFGRPRDIMNIYKQLIAVLDGGKLTISDSYQAISDYISETVTTIINEYSFVQPNLYEILSEFEKADSLCNWEYIRVRVAQKGAAAVQVKEIGNVINTLYEIGLFGILSRPAEGTPPIHSLDVEYCYNRRRKAFKRHDFVMHPVFRYEYSMKDNSKEYLKNSKEFG